MPYTISATVNTNLPGTADIGVVGDAGQPATIYRVDGPYEQQPVRNFADTGTGIEQVADAEAPLGRPFRYRLVSPTQGLLAESNTLTVPAPADGRSLLRSVLKPQVAWAWVEPADESNVVWRTSTRSYEIVGSDTPVIIGEVRQRHSGRISLLCKSVPEANAVVQILRDGLPMLLRHSPCANQQTRDMLFYALSIDEQRVNRDGWRVLDIEYQSTRHVPGETLEPPASWTFQALSDAHTDFQELMASYRDFQDVALNRPVAAGTGGSLF